MTVVVGAAARATAAGAARAGGAARAAGAGAGKAAKGAKVPKVTPAEKSNAAAQAKKLRGDGLTDDKVRRNLAGSFHPDAVDHALTPETPPAAPADTGSDSGPAVDPEPAPESEPAPAAEPATTSTPAAGRAAQGAGGGLMLAILLHPLAVAYLRGGTPRVKQWMRAKFLNQTGAAPATAGGNGQSGSAPGAGGAGQGGSGSSSGSW